MSADRRSSSLPARAAAPSSSLNLAAASPLGVASAREVDDHVAHDARGEVEEVGAVLGREPCRSRQPQVGLVDERRGVERRARAAVRAELRLRQAVQVGVDAAE